MFYPAKFTKTAAGILNNETSSLFRSEPVTTEDRYRALILAKAHDLNARQYMTALTHPELAEKLLHSRVTRKELGDYQGNWANDVVPTGLLGAGVGAGLLCGARGLGGALVGAGLGLGAGGALGAYIHSQDNKDKDSLVGAVLKSWETASPKVNGNLPS